MSAQSNTRSNSPDPGSAGDQSPATKALLALRKLDAQVMIYRSLGDLDENGKLARVSLRNFADDFELTSAQVGPLLAEIPRGKLLSSLTNALASYRDGLFWWRQIDRPRLVHVSALAASGRSKTGFDTALRPTIPYTVAIHWRHARKYLDQAENSLSR